MSRVILVGDALHVVPHLLSACAQPRLGFPGGGGLRAGRRGLPDRGAGDVPGYPVEAASAALRHGVDGVIVSSTARVGPTLVKQIAWAIEGADIDLLLASALTDVAGPRIHSRPVEGMPLIHVEEPQFEGGTRWAKNLMDRGIALIGLVLLSPLFFGHRRPREALAARGRSSSARPGWGCAASTSRCTSSARWCRTRTRAWPSTRSSMRAMASCSSCVTTPGSPRSARCCAAGRSMSCPSSSTCSTAPWPWWARGRRCPARSSSMRATSTAGCSSSPASPACGR